MNDSEEIARRIREQTALHYLFGAFGPFNLLILLLAVITCFILLIFLLTKGKGQSSVIAIFITMHFPLLICVYAAVSAVMSGFLIVAHSTQPPGLYKLADVFGTTCIPLLVGFVITLGFYLITSIVLTLRAFRSPAESAPLPAKVL